MTALSDERNLNFKRFTGSGSLVVSGNSLAQTNSETIIHGFLVRTIKLTVSESAKNVVRQISYMLVFESPKLCSCRRRFRRIIKGQPRITPCAVPFMQYTS